MEISEMIPGRTYLVKVKKGIDLEAFNSFYQQCKANRIRIVAILVDDPSDVAVTADESVGRLLHVSWMETIALNGSVLEKHLVGVKDMKGTIIRIAGELSTIIRGKIKDVLAGEKADRSARTS
jgi:hypothetical protein